MSLFEDIVNSCLYGNLYIKNTQEYIGISISNDTNQISYLYKKQKTNTTKKVVYKKIK